VKAQEAGAQVERIFWNYNDVESLTETTRMTDDDISSDEKSRREKKESHKSGQTC